MDPQQLADPTFAERFRDSAKALATGHADLSLLPPAAQEIIHSPNRGYLIFASVSVYLIYFGIRIRLLRKAKGLDRVWMKIYATLGLLAAQLVLVPWLVFGDTYFAFAREVADAFTKNYKGP